MQNKSNRLLTPEQDARLRELAPTISESDLADKLNQEFGLSLTRKQINGYKKNHKIKGRGSQASHFKKGIPPATKGKKWWEFRSPEANERCKATQFQKGHVPHNNTGIGTERVNVYGYVEVRVEQGKTFDCGATIYYRPKHHIVWESANGQIPPKYIIRHMDGDKLNNALSNLELVSLAENAVINRQGLFTVCPEINKTAILIARVKTTASARRKSKQRKEKRNV